ncbi:MAG: DmsE family decaheme c-type cytochrome [Gammaproteobacteria bacterium]|nr:DmsE family decaheme c-type cytochrome [Gammaproteobacteria bacterium]
MNIKHPLFAALLLLSGLMFNLPLFAETPPAAKQASEYSEKGADTCLVCHNANTEFPVFAIFETKHGQRADKRSPFAGLQCEACHGPGANHATKLQPINTFGTKSKLAPDKLNPLSTEQQNQVCLDCHRGDARIGWNAVAHLGGNLACTSCHKIHAAHDPVLAKSTQPEVCYACHKKTRADFSKPSVHPVRFGQLACSDCHQPHESNVTALLTNPTKNQTCYTCHADKRGPLLWEHAPVTEDCTLCHNPHGSVHASLLKKSPPLLCQQCHSPAIHPQAHTGASLPGGSPSGFLLAGSCTNCHSQVHGSNHPSGVKLMR